MIKVSKLKYLLLGVALFLQFLYTDLAWSVEILTTCNPLRFKDNDLSERLGGAKNKEIVIWWAFYPVREDVYKTNIGIVHENGGMVDPQLHVINTLSGYVNPMSTAKTIDEMTFGIKRVVSKDSDGFMPYTIKFFKHTANKYGQFEEHTLQCRATENVNPLDIEDTNKKGDSSKK